MVEALASLMIAVGDMLGGGRATGIVLTVIVVRTALIPLLLPLAGRTRARQQVVRRIRPQIKALDRELRDQPSELSKRLKALHEENGIRMVDWPGLGGAFIQLPILIAMFQAVLLVWEPQAMSLMALVLGIGAAGLSLLGTKLSGQADGARWMLWLATILPVAICLWLGPGVALYLLGFYASVSLQGLLMERGKRMTSPAES